MEVNNDVRPITGDDPLVGIVVVHWNSYRETADCLDSLEDLDYPRYRVVVVDNGSTDGSEERLSREFGDHVWCELVHNDSNRGFAGGVNTGIDSALSEGVQYVLLLNNDARIEPGAVRELVDVAAESGAGVVGATIVDGTGTPVNATPSRHPDMLIYSGYRDRLPFVSDEPPIDDRWWETDRVEGAGALLSRELLERRQETVGFYLDESLFMYCEEVELGLWCRKHGERVVIAADAVIRHEGGASSNRAFQLYYLTRNRVLIAHRYLDRLERALFDGSYPLTRLLRASRYAKDGQGDVAAAIVNGLLDGYRHISGQIK